MFASSSSNGRFGTTGIQNINSNCFFAAPMQNLYPIIPFLKNKTLQLVTNNVKYGKDVDGVFYIVKANLAVEDLQRWFMGMSTASRVYEPAPHLPSMVSYDGGNERNGVFPEWKADDPFHFQEIPIPDVPPPTYNELYGIGNGYTCDARDSYEFMLKWVALAQDGTEELVDLFQTWSLPKPIGINLVMHFCMYARANSFEEGLNQLLEYNKITVLPPVFALSGKENEKQLVHQFTFPKEATEHLTPVQYVLHAFVALDIIYLVLRTIKNTDGIGSMTLKWIGWTTLISMAT